MYLLFNSWCPTGHLEATILVTSIGKGTGTDHAAGSLGDHEMGSQLCFPQQWALHHPPTAASPQASSGAGLPESALSCEGGAGGRGHTQAGWGE